jgi:hypothetical protein
MELHLKENFELHPDYQTNLRWTLAFMKKQEENCPQVLHEGIPYGMVLKLLSLSASTRSILWFMYTSPPSHKEKQKWANPLTLHQPASNFQGTAVQNFNQMRKIASVKLGVERWAVPQTFDKPTECLKEAMDIVKEKFKFI